MATKTEKLNDQGEKLVSIRLPLTKEEKDAVYVRVNERTWLIPRGQTVEVPECVVEVLDHAETATLESMKYQSAHEKNA